MTEELRQHWDERYRQLGPSPGGPIAAPPLFAAFEQLFPSHGSALDVACGRGRGSAWLANRGLTVHGFDISPVAIDLARTYAHQSGVSSRCRFDVHDLSHGLPPGHPVDLVICYLFREATIDQDMIDRLNPGGMLAVACLSEVGHGPGRFRAAPGELRTAFAELELLESGEENGHAWFVGRLGEQDPALVVV